MSRYDYDPMVALTSFYVYFYINILGGHSEHFWVFDIIITALKYKHISNVWRFPFPPLLFLYLFTDWVCAMNTGDDDNDDDA